MKMKKIFSLSLIFSLWRNIHKENKLLIINDDDEQPNFGV